MENQETSNRQHPKSTKLLPNKLLKCYSNAFKKHWNNTDNLCEHNFAYLRHVSADWVKRTSHFFVTLTLWCRAFWSYGNNLNRPFLQEKPAQL